MRRKGRKTGRRAGLHAHCDETKRPAGDYSMLTGIFWLFSGLSIRWNTSDWGKTFVWEELDLLIADSSLNFCIGEFFYDSCLIEFVLKENWDCFGCVLAPGMPSLLLKHGRVGGDQSSRGSSTSSGPSTWTPTSIRWDVQKSLSRIQNRYWDFCVQFVLCHMLFCLMYEQKEPT